MNKNELNFGLLYLIAVEIGDRLLPLSADVEESPFLTLQEVEEISKQKIVSAHAGREVPEVDNPTWKTANDGNGTNALDALPQPIEISDSDFSATIDVAANEPAPVDIYIGHQIPEDFLKKAGLLHDDGEREREVRPIYKLNADGSLPGMKWLILFRLGIQIVLSIYRNAKRSI